MHIVPYTKACKKRAAELREEALFKEHPPPEDCPICFLPLPYDDGQVTFHSCCGKRICSGCIVTMIEEACGRGKIGLCAFCREPTPSSEEEEVNRTMKLIEVDNAHAFRNLAGFYANGGHGIPQDMSKANELYLRAGELGCAEAYCNLGISYNQGRGVKVNKKKAKHCWELAAMNGNVVARHNLGVVEVDVGNMDRAYKHFILGARAGYRRSLDVVKQGYMKSVVTKDEYANTLRAYQQRHDEMISEARDKAAALRMR